MLKPGVQLISSTSIQKEVLRVAGELSDDYGAGGFLGLIVLKGAFVFASDLIRRVSCPLETGFMYSSSYSGTQRKSSQEKYGILAPEKIKGKRIVVIEDIIDSGQTCRNLLALINRYSPVDVKLCSLLVKPESRGRDFQVDYKGFEISDSFVVGYGLDFDERFRELPDIRILEESE